jgi:proton glutamate symport protein
MPGNFAESARWFWISGAGFPWFQPMKRPAAHWQILVALALATLTALVFRNLGANEVEGSRLDGFIGGVLGFCAFVGDLFMRALKMIIVPLIVTSVVSGIASLQGVKGFGRLGAKTAAFFISTSFLSILLGLFLVNTIRPGLEDGKPNTVIREAFEQTAAEASDAVREKVSVASGRERRGFS